MLIDSRELYQEFVEELNFGLDHQIITLDIESNGLNSWKDQMIGVALHLSNIDACYYLPFRHGIKDEYDAGFENNLPESILKDFVHILNKLNGLGVQFLYHNAKFDIIMLHIGEGVDIPNNLDDTMIMAHLNNENEKSHGLKQLSDKYIGGTSSDSESKLINKVIEAGHVGKTQTRKAKANMWRLRPEDVAEYAEMDVQLTYELYEFMFGELERQGLIDLYRELIDEYFLKILIPAQVRGLKVDENLLHDYWGWMDVYAESKLEDIRGVVDDPNFNPKSPAQVSELLSTPNAQELTLLHSDHPMAEKIIEYKKSKKICDTFYKPLTDKFNDGSGYVHPNLNIIGTKTGRLSCREPNLQQYPRYNSDMHEQYNVKRVFAAPDGYKFVAFDFGQLELRIACHYAKQQSMIDAFLSSADPHQLTANALGVDRHAGKTANFALLYGQGPGDEIYVDARNLNHKWGVFVYSNHNLTDSYSFDKSTEAKSFVTKQYGIRLYWKPRIKGWSGRDNWRYISVRKIHGGFQEYALKSGIKLSYKESKKIVNDWRALYPDFYRMVSECDDRATRLRLVSKDSQRRDNFIRLFTGRMRHFADIIDDTWLAWNSLVQGTGSEINRITAQRIAEQCDPEDVQIVMLIHDSVLMYIKDNKLDYYLPLIQELGESWNFTVPMEFEAKIGNSWGELK